MRKWRKRIGVIPLHSGMRRGRTVAPTEALEHYRVALSLAPERAETNTVYGLMLLQLDRV